MFQTVAALIIFAATLLLIITRPYKLNEAIIALGGAGLMLATLVVSPADALAVLADKLDVFFFFLGLMTIAAIAESANFFDWTAAMAAKLARASGRRLFLNVFLLGVIISTFLSNDATALILTPVVYSLVTRLRINPLPFMFACTFIADTASFVLPVSNPINILVLGQFPADLFHFWGRLLVPAILSIAINIAFFFWLFRRDLPLKFSSSDLATPEEVITNKAFFRYVAICLGLTGAGYLLASALRVPLSIVAMSGAGLLVGGALYFRQITLPKLAREISWPLFGFIGGMFIVVRGVENIGLTGQLGQWLVNAAGGSLLPAIFITTIGTAIGANLINNVPMTLVMLSALAQQAQTLTPQLRDSMAFSIAFGADLGPNLTTIGSLATVLWLVILRRKGLEISSVQYFKIGVLITPVMLLVGALAIWVSYLLF